MSPPNSAALALDSHSRRGLVHAAVATMRPRQWIKNGLVIAAPIAAGALGHDDVPARVTVAFAAFCMLASGIYAINDVRDAAEDRLHPRKRFRPVAAGELDSRAAVGLGTALMAGGLALCFAVKPLLGAVGAGYVALTLTYSFVWRHVALLDLVAIAGGFVLRAVAGGVAAPVSLSRWFLLVIAGAAVCVAAAKRYSELERSDMPRELRRKVLQAYTPLSLQLILAAGAAVTLAAYCVWAFQLPSVNGFPLRPLTVVPFAVCMVRYGALVRRGLAEAPEDVLLADRTLQLAALAWIVIFALGVQAAS